MTKLVNTFKAAGAALAQGNPGYRNKMAQAVNLVEIFQRHGLRQPEIEAFSATQQQGYED